MADEDEIDILGDFSFNSCFAQNNQGIPSCSNREDTVHPQWLLDSTVTNWYDNKSRDAKEKGLARKLMGNSCYEKYNGGVHTAWSQDERELLNKEMAKYGRNVRKISQTIKTKTEVEIQALIEAEYGVNLDTPIFGLEKNIDQEDIPTVIEEEVVTDDMSNVLNMVATGSPTIPVPKKPFRKKNYSKPAKNSLLKPDVLSEKQTELLAINPAEILYEDDLVIGSTESIGSDLDLTDIVSKNIVKYQAKVKAGKKIGNHRRKISRNYDKNPRNSSKDLLKSPQGRQRKDSALSDDSAKSPKLHIVLGSGQSLHVSEGEQVIKIEKKKDSEPESDIEIDVDSDNEDNTSKSKKKHVNISTKAVEEAPIAVPLRKFEPMPRRQKKINLDVGGAGGYTIMHTESGDLYEVGSEPRRERQPRKQPVHLIQCRVYNTDKPAPYSVRVLVSALISMDCHAHTSRAEVMGLIGGTLDGNSLVVAAYRTAVAAAGSTHCDMEPVSQAIAAESLRAISLCVCGWHHSHPVFPAAPSARDLHTQRALQRALEPALEPALDPALQQALEPARAPFLGLITSQHWPTGRTASQYRCIRVEDIEDPTETPIGYQFSVKLLPDLTMDNLAPFLIELKDVLCDEANKSEYSVDMAKDVCPQARITYLEKCISSITHHMHSAGYEDNDPVTAQLIQGIRDVYR